MTDKKTPLNEMSSEELEARYYHSQSDEEIKFSMWRSSESNRVTIDKAHKDIQYLINLNKKQMNDFKEYHRQFINLSAFLVVCIIAILINVSAISFEISMPEKIAQSKIWFWISYPYEILVGLLTHDNFISNNIPIKTTSFFIVLFIYSSALMWIVPRVQSKFWNESKSLEKSLSYPPAISFIFLFGIFIVGLPLNLILSLLS